MTDTDKMREAFEKWLDQGNHCGCNENMWKAWQAAPSVPKLSVWYGSMPESNGKSNWTAILVRDGDISSGITIARSEYPDRVRYEADRMRFLIGEISDEPFILDYDEKKHSGYVAPEQSKSVPVVGEPVFVIFFDDTEVRPEVFMGAGAEDAARYRHKELLLRWNCHLLTTVPTISISAAELERMQKDAELGQVIREKYSGMKTSTSERFLEAIGVELDEDAAWTSYTLETLLGIDAAIAAEGEK